MTSGPFWATLAVRYLVKMFASPGKVSISILMPGFASWKRAIAW